MMIAWKTLLSDCVIVRRGMTNTASFLWSCQKHCLPFYLFGIISFLLGFFHVAPVMGGEKTVSANPPAPAESASADASVPMTDIHDILPPIPAGLDVPWGWVALIALAAAGLAALAWWLWKRRSKTQAIETIVPELPPELIARQALDQISDVRGMDGKTFYFRLSAIVRQYVSGRFKVGAVEMTTEEFLPCIDRLNTEGDLARRLKQLCRSMDPVKFGGAAAMEKQMEADLLFTREFVHKTTQEIRMDGSINNGEENPKKRIPILK